MSSRSRGGFLACLAALTVTAGLNETRLAEALKASDRKTVQALLKQGADVNAADTDGTTPPEWAVRGDDIDTVQMLLRAGANPKAANRYGVTPLSLAAANGNAAILEILLKAGADPAAPAPGGQTVLMIAARTGNPDAVKLLLGRGLDANAREAAYGGTALMWAAAGNHAEAARVLVAHGADINARPAELKYPQDRFGLEGVLTILPHGSWAPLMYAVREGSLDAARALAEGGADLNLTDPDGTTALVLAIINGHFDTAALLLDNGADPNIADMAGMAALYAAVDMNTLGEVYGRPARPSRGKLSALDLIGILLRHATGRELLEAVKVLVARGVDVNAANDNGQTAMHFAVRVSDDIVRYLAANGAALDVKDKQGRTPLDAALGMGVRGRAGGPVEKREATAELLRQLMGSK